MELMDILCKKVSYQDHFSTEIKEKTLNEVLTEIKGKKHINKTNNLRKFYDKGDIDNYNYHKRNLPVVAFCGTFRSVRKKEFLNNYNYIIILDIDKLRVDELKRVKIALLNDQYVFSFWESPSKNGIKGLVFLKYNFNIIEDGEHYSHKVAFKQLINYFQATYKIELDISGNDITRLCFLSWDPELVLKDNVCPFEIEEDLSCKVNKNTTSKAIKQVKTKSKDIFHNPEGKNNHYHRKTMENIIKFLKKNKLSITKTYDDWYRVGFAIANSFTYDVGEKYFIELSQLDIEKYNEINCKNMLINCYENSRGKFKFNSIIHFASEKGFIYKKINTRST